MDPKDINGNDVTMVFVLTWKLIENQPAHLCVCVCLALNSARLLGPPFAEVGIRKSRPPGNPEGPRHYLLVR